MAGLIDEFHPVFPIAFFHVTWFLPGGDMNSQGWGKKMVWRRKPGQRDSKAKTLNPPWIREC